MILRFLNLAPVLLLIISVHVFTPLIWKYYYYWDYFLAERYSEKELFDFIVVGAGSAGAVVAHRLSKNSNVLLLEAGGDPLPFNSVSGLANELQNIPQINWNHATIPQKHSMKGFPNNVSFWPRGKVLGGSSTINWMFYVRGNPKDYNNWANLSGDLGWNYSNLVPYFEKSLSDGLLHAEERKEWAPTMYNYFIEGVKELGLEEGDTNGPLNEGFGPAKLTQKEGARYGTYSAFLKGWEGKNLKISRYSHVTKIKLSKDGRAEGVWYERHGETKFAAAAKEIILSGGAIDSPKLLMLSGIGPKEHLKEVNIKPLIDLPGVGQNLKDHLAVLVFPFVINQELSIILTRDLGWRTLYDYFFNGYGPFTSPAALHTHGFISSSHAASKDWPDLQIYLSLGGVFEGGVQEISRLLGYNLTFISSLMRPLNGLELDAFNLVPTLVLPKSKGELKLRDNSPHSQPLIDPRYLEDERDLKVLVEGIKFSIKLAEETKSFKELDAKLVDLEVPGCEGEEMRSDKYWECYVRHMAFTLYHPVGTCRMGRAEDKWSVVDTKLRVIGTQNLRVADASIFPEIPNGNTNAPAIMVGEKAADLIREYWAEQYEVCPSYQLMEGKGKCFYSKIV